MPSDSALFLHFAPSLLHAFVGATLEALARQYYGPTSAFGPVDILKHFFNKSATVRVFLQKKKKTPAKCVETVTDGGFLECLLSSP